MGNTGNKGKFSERIKKIRFDRLRKKKRGITEDSEAVYKNFLKVVAVIPLIVADNVFEKNETNKKKQIVVDGKIYLVNDDHDKSIVEQTREEYRKLYLQKKKLDREKIENIDVSLIKKKQAIYLKSVGSYDKTKNKETIVSNNQIKKNIDNRVAKGDFFEPEGDIKKTTSEDVKKLEKQIIDLIKKDLTKIVNELEIYESELYILNEINNDEKTLEECRKNIAAVKKILEKIDEIKKKYEFLRDNYDFEYLLEANNEVLIDKIIELKNLFGENEVRATVDDYKLLEVYKFLYLKVDDIHEKTYQIEKEKEKKEEELKDRDINFDKLKDKVYDVNKINNSYKFFVEQQNELMKSIADKISKIDANEIVSYEFKGYGKYMLNSFKYLGLLMLSPLKGIFPAIATQILLTKNVVGNLHNNITFKEHRKMVYDAIDFSGTLYHAINDLDYTSNMVDNTLNDLARLKMEYNDKFKQYQGDFLEYRSVIDKINKLQANMINNKFKIEIMRSRMKTYKKQNENTLKLVRKMNAEEERKQK